MCGKSFTLDHTLSCPTGGYPTICHNEICDLTTKVMTEVCHDVCTFNYSLVRICHMLLQIGKTLLDLISKHMVLGNHSNSVPILMQGSSILMHPLAEIECETAGK